MGEKNFKFNFPIIEIEKLNINEDNSNGDAIETNDNNCLNNTGKIVNPLNGDQLSNNDENIRNNSSDTVRNSSSTHKIHTKFSPSDNSFKFNFTIEN